MVALMVSVIIFDLGLPVSMLAESVPSLALVDWGSSLAAVLGVMSLPMLDMSMLAIPVAWLTITSVAGLLSMLPAGVLATSLLGVFSATPNLSRTVTSARRKKVVATILPDQTGFLSRGNSRVGELNVVADQTSD